MIIYPIAILMMESLEDRAFMEALYRTYGSLMHAVAYQILHNAEDAQDTVSDACVALIRKISVIRGLECDEMRGYIVSTVRNKAISRATCATARHETFWSEDAPEIPDHSPTPEQRYVEGESIEKLMNAIGRLSEREQSVLTMKYLQEMSDDEIGKALGIKSASVRSFLMRVKRRARRLIEEVTPDAGD